MNHEMNDEMTAAEKAEQAVEAATQEALHADLAQFASLDDVGNQMRLVKRFGRTLRFCAPNEWYTFGGQVWQAQEDDAAVREMAIEVTRLMQAEIDTIQDGGGAPPGAEAPERVNQAETPAAEAAPPLAKAKAGKSDGDKPKSEAEVKRAAYAAWRKTSRSARKIGDMVAMARSHPEVRASRNDFDNQPWLLAVGNGVLNLKTRNVRPGRPEDMLTQQMGVAYDPKATCPTWDAFLAQVQPDQAVRDYLQRYVGYCLTGLTREQIFLFFVGGGANGKGTFLDTMALLFGAHHSRIRANVIASGTAYAGEARFGLKPIVGRRLVTFGEVEERSAFNESLLKELTGEDTVEIEQKGKDAYNYLPIAKYILGGNHKPKVLCSDDSVWRRMKLVPFAVTIPPEKRDGKLREKLAAELPGILLWALDGLKAYLEDGMGKEPSVVSEATAEYRADSDVLGHFLDERCVLGPGEEVKGGCLYAHYNSWCLINGYKPLANNSLASRLKERGLKKGEGRQRYDWLGIRIITDLEREEKEEQEGGAIALTGPNGEGLGVLPLPESFNYKEALNDEGPLDPPSGWFLD